MHRSLTVILLCLVILEYFSYSGLCAGKDYYSILGVPRDAETRQIKKAYRELSLKYHPVLSIDCNTLTYCRINILSMQTNLLKYQTVRTST